jgi:Lytic transglycolase
MSFALWRIGAASGGPGLPRFANPTRYPNGVRSRNNPGPVMRTTSVYRLLTCIMTRRLRVLLLTSIFALTVTACTTSVSYTPPPQPPPSPPPPIAAPPPPPPIVKAAPEHNTVTTHASWYGPGLAGRKTATGERFSPSKMTAAAKGLPLGSQVVVTNPTNGHSVTVRINDCGPLKHGRKLDLSQRAARQLGIIHRGSAVVKVKVIHAPRGAPACES